MRRRRHALAALALTLSIALAACDGDPEDAAPASDTAASDASTSETSAAATAVESDDAPAPDASADDPESAAGAPALTGKQLPGGFPQEVPLVDGEILDVGDDGQGGFVVHMRRADAVEKDVADEAEARLSAAGFETFRADGTDVVMA